MLKRLWQACNPAGLSEKGSIATDRSRDAVTPAVHAQSVQQQQSNTAKTRTLHFAAVLFWRKSWGFPCIVSHLNCAWHSVTVWALLPPGNHCDSGTSARFSITKVALQGPAKGLLTP